MPRAVVILPTTTYRAADFVEAAEALGVDLVVASEEPSVLEMGDSFVHINCSDPGLAAKEVVAIGDDVPLDAIVAADDAGVVIAADASQQLGLLGNTPSAAESTRNKHLMRQALASAEIAQPDFELHNDLAPTRLAYPLVAKPLDRSASQGVIRVDEPEALDATVSRIRSIVDDPDAQVLLESFVGGREVAVEGLLRHGELLMLALFDKPDTPDGPVFPETIFVTPSRLPEELQRECIRVAQSACSALELTHGPVHIELKIDERDRVHVLELAARSIGGLCSRSLSFGLMDTSLEMLILRNALGLDKPELKREPHASGVLMIPVPRSGRLHRIDGLEDARALSGITGYDLSVAPGNQVKALPEGDSYLGFVYARADTPDLVETALRKANKSIQVLVR